MTTHPFGLVAAARPGPAVTEDQTPGVPAWVPAALVLCSLPFLRPGVFGETFALGGLCLNVLAAFAAFVRRERRPTRPVGVITVFVVLLCAAWMWMLLHGVWIETPTIIRTYFQDVAITLGSVLSAAIALADPAVRRATGRGFVLVLAVLGAGWLLTALWWTAFGIGSGRIGAVPVGDIGYQPVFFPFTISYSTSSVFGTDIPRLTGLGRESGWMAMYCAAGWFLADTVGYRSWTIKALLLAGLVGTISTAGFGVWVIVMAFQAFLSPRGGVRLLGFVRQIAGLAVMGLAAWLALDAPVLGLKAKEDTNVTSLSERQDATEEGLRALFTHPLGGFGTEKQSGINLISDIAVNGLPFVLLVVAALLAPALVARRGSSGRGFAVALVVCLTLLTSQPAAADTWAFLLVLTAWACGELTDAERAVPGHPRVARLHRRCAGRHRPAPSDDAAHPRPTPHPALPPGGGLP